MDKRILISGWCDVDDEFLAENLKKVFSVLETQEQVALHNDMVRQIQDIVEPQYIRDFLKTVSRYLKNRPKDYLRGIASTIRQYAMKGNM